MGIPGRNESTRIVGRSAERLALRDAVAALGDGAVCVEILGDPGIGKTTMLRWLADHAEAAGVCVLHSAASEFERDLPFGLFVAALDAHLSELRSGSLRAMDVDDRRELAAIFPALRRGDASPPSIASDERFRLYRRVRALLATLASRGPLAIALDDVQWSDPLSIELIGALLDRPPAGPVLLALSHRAGQAPARLLRALTAAHAAGAVRRVELGPLSEKESDKLLAPTIDLRERRRLIDQSGGNPFYLGQLARSIGGSPAQRRIDAGVPTAVAASLLAQLDDVSAPAREFAQAASVAGDPFDVDLAADIAGIDRNGALAALNELFAADLLRADATPLEFAFRHPLVRRAVYESAQPGWRIAAHERADASMARRGASTTARAHHIEQSARVGDREAVRVLMSAADGAVVPLASARWLQAALRLMPADSADGLAVRHRLGATLSAAGQLEESRAVLTNLLRRAPADLDSRSRTGLIVECAHVERLLGHFEQARARIVAATAALEEPNSEAGVALALELTQHYMFAAQFDKMVEPADAALRRAIALGAPLLVMYATVVSAFVAQCSCDLEAARRHVAEATELMAGLDVDSAGPAACHAFHGLGWLGLLLDEFETAVEHFTRGVASARVSGQSQIYVELASGRAEALTRWGRLAEARSCADEAVEAARLSDHPQPLAVALMGSCTVHRAVGDLAAAIANGRESIALAPDDSLVSATCGVHLGMALADAGEHDQAIEVILERAGGLELPRVFAALRPMVYDALVSSELARGERQRAEEMLQSSRAISDRLGGGLARSFHDRAAARVRLAHGDDATAARLALASADGADAVVARVEAGRSRLLASRALAACGERERAGTQLRAAEIQLAACGAIGLREQCVRELRRIGLRVARAGRRGQTGGQGPATLSRREREVAELVRARHTNREIAERLFLSEKTIESHLRSVFVKLDATSRAQVARALDADR